MDQLFKNNELTKGQLVLAGAVGASSLWFLYRKWQFFQRLSTAGKAVVISGCDTGFGRAAALRLVEEGYVVFAGCLDASTAASKTYAGMTNIRVLQMDVTSNKQVEDSVKEVTKWLDANPTHRLTGIVANAGVAFGGLTEMVSMEGHEKTITINLLGVVRFVRAFLPAIRRGGINREKADGRVVIMSSVAGLFSSPFSATYCASKSGVAMFGDSLRLEIERFGITVSLIFPDFYATGIVTDTDRIVATFNAMVAKLDPEVVEAYGGEATVEKMRNNLLMYPSYAQKDLSPVINAISHGLGGRWPKRRYYLVNLFYNFILTVNPICTPIAEWMIKRLLGFN